MIRYITSNMIIHRGLYNKLIPENSITSFKKCVERNLPFEMDVHILMDGEIIVFHDDHLERMTGLNKYVRNCNYSDIKSLYLKNTKEHIPTLDQVLNIVNGKVPILIELKFDQKRYLLEDALLQKLSKYTGKVLLCSFDYKAVEYLKKKGKYKVGIILNDNNKNDGKTTFIERYILKLFDFIKLSNPDFVSCELSMLPSKRIKKFRKKNRPVFIWSINNQEDLKKAKLYGDYFIVKDIV